MATFAHERARLVGELASIAAVDRDDLDQALHNTRWVRNPVSALSTVAQLAELSRNLATVGVDTSRWWHTRRSPSFGPACSPAEDLLAARLTDVAVELAELLAGPYDVEFDGNWPPERAERLIELPTGAAEGDVVVGNDSGNRMQIRVVRRDAELVAEPIRDTWTDAPGTDVWCETYERLAQAFPAYVPPPPTWPETPWEPPSDWSPADWGAGD